MEAMTDIHEELNRLILRRRWIVWCDRQWVGCPRKDAKRMQRRLLVLASRLAHWKPTWEQREFRKRSFDGALP